MTRVSILTCFSPPEENDDEFVGDFGWVSGFTANPEVLAQMADRFTSGERRRRPSLAVFLHPSARHLPLVQGVTMPFRRPAVGWGFNLLHAKVALLHFRGKRGSLLRLVVSTGNWTHGPISTSLDLFWIVEWRSDAPDPISAESTASATPASTSGKRSSAAWMSRRPSDCGRSKSRTASSSECWLRARSRRLPHRQRSTQPLKRTQNWIKLGGNFNVPIPVNLFCHTA